MEGCVIFRLWVKVPLSFAPLLSAGYFCPAGSTSATQYACPAGRHVSSTAAALSFRVTHLLTFACSNRFLQLLPGWGRNLHSLLCRKARALARCCNSSRCLPCCSPPRFVHPPPPASVLPDLPQAHLALSAALAAAGVRLATRRARGASIAPISVTSTHAQSAAGAAAAARRVSRHARPETTALTHATRSHVRGARLETRTG